MPATVHQGNVFDVLPTLKPSSVDCCVTSPPYWMLRSYLPKGHALKPLELGGERTPAEYVANMVRVFGLVRTVLADHGTCWLNIGDTYCDDSKHGGATTGKHVRALHGPDQAYRDKKTSGIAAGSMALIPWRLAIGLQDDGWLVRSVVVWHKPACMPASLAGWRWARCRVKAKSNSGNRSVKVAANGRHRAVASFRDERTEAGRALSAEGNPEWSDCPGCKKCEANGGLVLRRGSWRPTSSWEPVLMLAKQQGYFADGEAVKQPSAAATVSRNKYTRVLDDPDEQFAVRHDHETVSGDANLRDVWTIASEPLREKHYAAYPSALVRNCLLAGTSAKGYCPTCGKPWCRIVESKAVPHPEPRKNGRAEVDTRGGNQANGSVALAPEVATLGWRPTCRCPEAEPRPGLVLDPFAGSGRTGLEANRLGLDFVGIDLNQEFVDMSRRLLREASPLFAG